MSDDDHFAGRYEWERIMRRCRMKPLTKYVGMVLAQYANNDGTNAFPAVAKLARVTCLSERSVRNALTELRSLGLIKRVQKGGMRGTQATSDMHCLVIPADLLERFDLLTPGEEDPNPPTPNRQEKVAQPAPGGSPTGTTCLLPISTYQPNDLDLPTDDSSFATRPTTGPDLDAIRAELERIDELAELRQRKASGQ